MNQSFGINKRCNGKHCNLFHFNMVAEVIRFLYPQIVPTFSQSKKQNHKGEFTLVNFVTYMEEKESRDTSSSAP